MQDYLIMTLEAKAEHQNATPAQLAALIQEHASFAKQLRASGAYRDGERLRPSREAKRLRRHAGAIEVTDGPFDGESHELGGYYMVAAPSLSVALELAQQCPMLAADSVELRPVMKGGVTPDKTHQPGKVFAFAVLGNAPNEAAWVSLMDRIDAETHDNFPDSNCGGVRLEAPKLGRRIAWQKGKRAALDGPFLESKEVIGGLFFLRMPSIEEAVRWACDTGFVTHGTLEIRELWRS